MIRLLMEGRRMNKTPMEEIEKEIVDLEIKWELSQTLRIKDVL